MKQWLEHEKEYLERKLEECKENDLEPYGLTDYPEYWQGQIDMVNIMLIEWFTEA